MYRMFHIQTHSSSFKMRINLHSLANNYKYTIVEIFSFQLWFFFSYLVMSFSPIRSIFLCPYFFSVCSYKYVIYYIVETTRQLVSLSLCSAGCVLFTSIPISFLIVLFCLYSALLFSVLFSFLNSWSSFSHTYKELLRSLL